MSRFKKILKWTAIVAGATVALLLIVNVLGVWRTGSQLAARLDELRQAGEPVRLVDLGRKPIPPETNADTFLRRADADLQAIQKELEAMYPRVGYPQGKPTPAEQEKLEKLFAAHPDLIPMLEQAAAAPDHAPQLDTTLSRTKFLESCIDLATQHRPIYRILRARSELLLAQGHPDEAVAAQLLLLRLTRQWRREPMMLGYLVTAVGEYIAMEVINQVLQAGPVAPATRQAIEAELTHHDTMDGYTHALRTERALSLETAREMPGARFWPVRIFTNSLMLRLIDLYDRYLAAASQPFLQVAEERKAVPRPLFHLNPYDGLVTLLEPSLLSALEAGDRVRAMARSLRVLNALQERAGVSPKGDSIARLVDLGLPHEATIDPFNGEPLRVKSSPRGWTVYSVSRNGVDDGGELGRAVDVGVGPPAPSAAAAPAPAAGAGARTEAPAKTR